MYRTACERYKSLQQIKPTEDDIIIPFSDYAACRMLSIRAEEAIDTPTYQFLKQAAADFLNANLEALQESLRRLCSIQRAHEVANQKVLLYEYLSNTWERVDALVALNTLDLDDLAHVHPQDANLGTFDSGPLHFSDSLSSFDSVQDLASSNLKIEFAYKPSAGSPNSKPYSRFRVPVRRVSVNDLAGHDSASRSHVNWQRALRAAIKYLHKTRLKASARKLNKMRTMQEIFRCVSSHGQERPPDHQPLLLLLGGGMAAGKSTVRELIGRSEFWSKMGSDAVVVEADALKSLEGIRRRASTDCGAFSLLQQDACFDQFVHEYSTRAAEAMLLAAINEQKDVVFDGTHVWAPFIEQTIAMVRDYKHNYVQGPGYVQEPDGSVSELYWLPECPGPKCDRDPHQHTKRPYRIEIVGVTCHPGLAVARGIWRRLRTGRGVPVTAQLQSHRGFASNFERFSKLVDSATLYHTGNSLTMFNKAPGTTAPKAIAHSSAATLGDMLINPGPWQDFSMLKDLHINARCAAELFPGGTGGLEPPLRVCTELGRLAQLLHGLRAVHQQDTALLPQEQLEPCLLHSRSIARGEDLPEGLLRAATLALNGLSVHAEEEETGSHSGEEAESEEEGHHWSFGGRRGRAGRS